MTDDDLTTAYILGVEHIRGKMHQQADEIELIRAENDQLKKMIKLYDEMVAVLLPSWDQKLNDDDKAGYMIGYITTKKTLRQK
jgi:hypothetical protein